MYITTTLQTSLLIIWRSFTHDILSDTKQHQHCQNKAEAVRVMLCLCAAEFGALLAQVSSICLMIIMQTACTISDAVLLKICS
jgi:hypothetical protein